MLPFRQKKAGRAFSIVYGKNILIDKCHISSHSLVCMKNLFYLSWFIVLPTFVTVNTFLQHNRNPAPSLDGVSISGGLVWPVMVMVAPVIG